uniref:Homeobox domain-containing protein n=1 Tax=Esox lucius TaxID=8010 RepID=A0A3P9ADW5_ESOLU
TDMANFSVEWLSKSCYNTVTGRVDVKEDTTLGRHCRTTSQICGEVFPRAPSTYTRVSVEFALQRRLRTKFTTDQISRLERTFNKHKYLGATQRRKIAEKLKLSETQVKTWFQNRRMKLKREVQDLRPEFFAPPASLLPPLVYRVPMQPMVHQQTVNPLMLPPCYY